MPTGLPQAKAAPTRFSRGEISADGLPNKGSGTVHRDRGLFQQAPGAQVRARHVEADSQRDIAPASRAWGQSPSVKDKRMLGIRQDGACHLPYGGSKRRSKPPPASLCREAYSEGLE